MTSANKCTDPVNRKVTELMPWYVNGTLPEDEKAVLEGHLKECLVCRAALKQEQRTQGLMRMRSDLPLSSRDGIVELLQRIDRRSARPPTLQRGRRLAWGAAFAVSIVLVWVALVPDSQQSPFSTLTVAGPSESGLIDVVFADSIPEREIREIVRAVDGQLVAGPSEIGRYTLSVPSERGGVAEVIRTLSADPRIEFVGQSFMPAPVGDPEESR